MRVSVACTKPTCNSQENDKWMQRAGRFVDECEKGCCTFMKRPNSSNGHRGSFPRTFYKQAKSQRHLPGWKEKAVLECCRGRGRAR